MTDGHCTWQPALCNTGARSDEDNMRTTFHAPRLGRHGRTVIGKEEDDRVVRNSKFGDPVPDLADFQIDIFVQ